MAKGGGPTMIEKKEDRKKVPTLFKKPNMQKILLLKYISHHKITKSVCLNCILMNILYESNQTKVNIYLS